MEFLSKVQPAIDFRFKQVTVVHKNVQYRLPTCVIASGKNGVENQCSKNSSFGDHDRVQRQQYSGSGLKQRPVLFSNSFEGLEVQEGEVEAEHATATAQPFRAGKCPEKRAKCQRQCVQCGKVFVGRAQYCPGCDDTIFSKFSGYDLKYDHKQLDVSVLGLKAFVKRGKRQEFDYVGLLQFDNERAFDEQLNFTHRATLGGGDDADAQSDLSDLAVQQMSKLKQKYPEVFSEPSYPVDRSECPIQFQHAIPLVDESAPPPKRKLYPLDQRELDELKKQLKDFLDSGRIEVANGAYGAPILFAKKKDGGLRMCIDYRALNGQTQSDVYPLPRLDELLQRLDGAIIFSKFDMRDGYHQIPMQPSDKVKTSFTCRYGTFQFTVMPFGLSTAPSTFQRMMNSIFFDLLDKGVLCYLDDLLVYSRTLEDHIELLDQVFALLAKHKLYLKEKKCSLFLKQVNFLGHVVSAEGVAMESGKVEVVQKWPTPTTVTHVQQFLGLCNYYRRFILRFSEVAGPLTLLTRKGQQFVWGEAQVKAFETLKLLLCQAPVLKVFDTSLQTRVVCDASNFCVGGVLEQCSSVDGHWHPVEYYSKRLSTSERNYSATDREYVAIRQCLERWRHFLIGTKFKILTDHVALTYIQSSATVSRRNARWLEFLSQFDFTIEHIRGRENVIADALSRVPGSESLDQLLLCSLECTLGVWHVDDVGEELLGDCWLSSVVTIFENKGFLDMLRKEQEQCQGEWFLGKKQLADSGSNVFVYRNGVLCKLVKDHFCPVLPDCHSNTIRVVLSDLHSSSLGGHLGYRKLLKLASSRFYWQNMCKSIEAYLKTCEVCQANKHSTQRPPGLLNPVENPGKPFEHVTMDFVVQLPTSVRGYDAIFSIVDRFSRVVRFVPCHTSISALECANLFFEHWICRFGVPKKIISDRDVRFTSQFWQQLFVLMGTKVALSTSYHPQTDGLTERFHRTIEQVLRCYCSGQQDQWCTLLSQCEFSLNSTFQDGVQESPFAVIHGFQPTIPLDVQLAPVQLPALQDFVEQRRLVQARVLSALEESKTRMVNSANRHRRDLEFSVGDKVWLSTKYLPVKGTSRKLSALWAGPYNVISRVGVVAYKLDLPVTWNIHNVFHVSQLKKVFGVVDREESIDVQGQQEYEVERVIGSRLVRGSREYLVKWKGYGDFENSWVKAVDMGNAQEVIAEYEAQSFPGKSRTRRGSGVRH